MEGWALYILIILNVLFLVLLINRFSRDENNNHNLITTVKNEFSNTRQDSSNDARDLRKEVLDSQKVSNDNVINSIINMTNTQNHNISSVEKRVSELVDSNEKRLDTLRESLENKIKSLQESNEKKLDKMREVVYEKLQSTLEKRLGESFKQVSDNLVAVQQGLGDMKNLATGVGDLKRMLTNVKTRGTWGEYQLGDILEQILTPDQYGKNIQPKPESRAVVEFAIKLPGNSEINEIYLPIDAKFPQEDYQRLVDATEQGEIGLVEKYKKSLLNSISQSAKEINAKYIEPPYTTDFAILFLPTEGLYAEALREPGFLEKLQHNYKVMVSGPTNLAATLNALRVGFRTLAIEKRSSEVWNTLSAVKTEFEKFGDVLTLVKKQLQTAANSIDRTEVRTRQMSRKLKDVEDMSTENAMDVLDLKNDAVTEI